MASRATRAGGAVLATAGLVWTALVVPAPANAAGRPSGRTAAAMTYDGASQTVLLFGGDAEFSDRGGELNDTWAWNGTAWKQRNPVDSPPPREHAALAYDAARNKVVLFGGTSDTCGTFTDESCLKINDTWIWDGIARTWTEVSPPVSPSARSGASIAYDKVSRKVVLFGGATSSSTFLNDTWTWDGTTWTLLTPSQSPSARRYATLAPDGNRLVLFSGGNSADTWTWNGTTWAQETPPASPPDRGGAGAAYDAVRKQMVLFGGSGSCCPTDLPETWAWNGTTRSWSVAATTGPASRFFHGMAYDAARQQVVVFGGTPTAGGGDLNDTWVWNGTRWKPKP